MSAIVDFFNGEPDTLGRTIGEIQGWSDDRLEMSHNSVQWLFPLHEPSQKSAGAPVLTRQDVEDIKESTLGQANLLLSLNRFRDFFGIAPVDNEKQAMWATDRNHNLLRVTRIIRSLRLLGLEPDAQKFFNEVSEIGRERRVSAYTRSFWEKAMYEDVWGPLQ